MSLSVAGCELLQKHVQCAIMLPARLSLRFCVDCLSLFRGFSLLLFYSAVNKEFPWKLVPNSLCSLMTLWRALLSAAVSCSDACSENGLYEPSVG